MSTVFLVRDMSSPVSVENRPCRTGLMCCPLSGPSSPATTLGTCAIARNGPRRAHTPGDCSDNDVARCPVQADACSFGVRSDDT